jgi:pimeloyl-ACP methyl ester carboxylesterase
VEQRIAETRLGDGTTVAYALAGEGPLLVYTPGWLSHLELSWAIPPQRRYYEALAQGRTLLRYDKPGMGLSGPLTRPYTMELELETLAAVIAASGADRLDLFGISLGCLVAARYAADHPSTVDKMVLYGGWVRGAELTSPAIRDYVLGLVTEHWGLGSDVLADIFMPEDDDSARSTFTRAAFTQYQREAATAEVARAMLALCYEVDIAEDLPRVEAPTLVLHRDRDRAAPVAQGRQLAAGIRNGQFLELRGHAHFPYVGDADAITRAARRFLGLPPLRRRSGPSLTPRQHVARLVSEGLTNRDIAERLHITERSAESHVERIRIRLGFRSRSQIAAWFVTGG